MVSIMALMCQVGPVEEYRVRLPSILVLLPSWPMVYGVAAMAPQPFP